MKIKNIIFDFDGVLVKNIELMFRINQETLNNFTLENFKDSFNGNTLNYYKDVNRGHLEFFYKRWREELLNETIDKKTLNFLEKNSDKDFYIISSNKEDILNKVLKNSKLENKFKRVLGKETHSSKIKNF